MNGAKIREMRRARGWSQQELARRAGISQAQIANLESGLSANPMQRTLEGIAKAFDMTLAEFVKSGEAPQAMAV
jgi:transcriptional regulator with XRE-family HTH domain